MNIDRVSLSKEEATWLSRYVLKMIIFMENAGKKDPKILERTTYKVLYSLKGKAEMLAVLESDVYDASLNRKQKILMQDLIGGVKKNLTGVIIPEYERRGGHEKALLAAKAQLIFFDTLMRKLR